MATAYRAEHIGSLLRPPELLVARERRERGEISSDQLREAEDRAILGAVAWQREAGLDVITDGEYRRAGWFAGFCDAVAGFEPRPVVRERRGPEGPVIMESTQQTIVAKLEPKRRIAGEEAAFMRAHAGVPFKITLTSPVFFMMATFMPGVSEKAYTDRAAAAHDLAAIIRSEVTALIEQGVPYVQIDAPQYTQIADPTHHGRMIADGWPPAQALEDAVAADVAWLTGMRCRGTTIGVHLCRGNVRGMWIAEGGYDAIAERLFTSLDVDRILLEYDTDRAGSFAPLRFIPKGVTVVLGLVTTKGPQLETRDELLRRIDEASKYVPVERLALSPQCGFATQAAGNPLSLDDQRRKLELIVDVAHHVWGHA